jgi:hypothetical protein
VGDRRRWRTISFAASALRPASSRLIVAQRHLDWTSKNRSSQQNQTAEFAETDMACIAPILIS